MGRCPILVSNGPLALWSPSSRLLFQIQNLRRTYNLLLPRLLSGQVEEARAIANGAFVNQPGATPQVSERERREG